MTTAFHVAARPGAVVVHVAGELDVSTVEAFRTAADEARRYPAPLVVVDLGATTFMESVGFGALAVLNEQLGREGRRLLVSNPSPVISRALQLLGLDRSLEVVAHVDLERLPPR